jgi:hypothetical protein
MQVGEDVKVGVVLLHRGNLFRRTLNPFPDNAHASVEKRVGRGKLPSFSAVPFRLRAFSLWIVDGEVNCLVLVPGWGESWHYSS